MNILENKVAVITGASRGIGAGIAEKFAACGASVALIHGGNEEKALAVRDEIRSRYSVKAEIYRCDVSSSEECGNTVKSILADFGTVDILVNNAGIVRDNLIAMMKDEEFDDVLNVNLKGAFYMIRALSRTFIRKKSGRIINIASVSGLMGTAGQANYAASKAGVIALTKTTAREFAAKNVTCNAIAPGFVTTDMTKNLDVDAYLEHIPLRRAGSPEDIADAAAFLASDHASYITGEVLRVDGGLAI